MQKCEKPESSNKPRIRTNPKVFEWAPLASLAPKKQPTKSKKYEQTQASNGSRIRTNKQTKPKIVNRVDSVRSADNQKLNPKSNHSKTRISG